LNGNEVPSDILEMIQYAKSKGIALCAYVYPCLPFESMSSAWTAGRGPYTLDLSDPRVTRWMVDTMLAFVEKTGAGGFAWDHDIFVPGGGGHYAQWKALDGASLPLTLPDWVQAWMEILAKLRARFPDIVMDHRQTNHKWGPWYQLAGSYAEPIAGDENPESSL
jgi:hypothetical protein